MKFKSSLQSKTIILITVFLVTVAALISISIYKGVGRLENEKAALQMNNAAIRESGRINKRMIEAETAVKSIHALADEMVVNAQSMKDADARREVLDQVQDVFLGMSRDSASIVATYMTFDPQLIEARDGIFYSRDEHGNMQSNEITDIARYDADDVEHIGWYTIPKRAGEPVWLDPYYNRNIDKWLISYVIPFYKDGQMVAVIGIDFDFQDIVTKLDQFVYKESGYAYLKSADGSVHYHEGFFEGKFHGDEMSDVPETGMELFRSGETGEETILYEFEGQKRVAAVTRLENGMQFFLSDSYNEIYHERDRLLWNVLFLASLIAIFTIAAVWTAVSHVVKPLGVYTNAIAEIENGNYQVELPEYREQELETMSRGIRMLGSSLQKQQELGATALAERNRALEDAISEAESANKAKTVFLSSMSHDIRTPMNAVMGLSMLAQKHLDEPERMRFYLSQIGVAGKQLLNLINNVLEISRIESNKVSIDVENTDTNEVFEGLKTIFENQARAKHLTFHFSCDLTHRYVYADRTHIEEILTNLISNAMKYTQDGGTIEVAFTELPGRDAEHVIIRSVVRDNGYGMSEEFQKKLFDSFEREKDATINGIQGTGLGMSIVKNLIDMMHGTIEVLSKKDIGTKITVEIPHRIGDEPDTEGCHTDEETVDPEVFRGRRVLLTEDNEINAMIAQEILEDSGFVVEHASNGQICVDMVTAKPADYYDLILMDIQMPILDGYQASRAIRAMEDEDKAAIPIIAMTANAFREDRMKTITAGMNAYTSKPIDIPELTSTLNRVLLYKQYMVDSAELRAFRKRYTAEGRPCGYFVYRDDEEETLVYADAETAAIFGCLNENDFMEYVGRSFRGMVQPTEYELIRQRIEKQQSESENRIDNIVYQIQRRDGEIRTVRDIGYKAFDGKELLYYVYITDITDITDSTEQKGQEA